MAKKLEYNTDYLFNYDVKESVNSIIDEVDGLVESVNDLVSGGVSDVRKKIGLVVLGQSNENGAVLMSYLNSHPQAFQSQRNPLITSDFEGKAGISKIDNFRWAANGSPWCKVYDDLYDHGYELLIRNCAIGSASWVNDAVGIIDGWVANTQGFWCRRDPIHPSDLGTSGKVISVGGRLFECVVGTETYVYYKNNGGIQYRPNGDKMPLEIDYVYSPISERKSTGSVQPDFASVTVEGQRITDNQVTWELISNTANLSVGYQWRLTLRGLAGFDPFGILRRTTEHCKALKNQGVERIFVYICNGQSDTTKTTTQYQTACHYMIQYFRAQGYEVILGLSSYFSGAMAGGYDNLTAGVNGALSQNSSDAGVHAGANLYQLMGTTTGQNGLTFDTSNVHLDGAGILVAGGHHANAIKSILPKLS